MTGSNSRTYAAARAAFVDLRRAENRLASLTHIRDAAKLRTSLTNQARSERLAYSLNPAQLAGAIAWKRRTDPTTAAQIVREYHRLLRDIAEGNGLTGARPLRVDFNALPSAARPYLLTPFIRLAVNGIFPHLDLARSDPERGHLEYVFTAGPADAALWRPLMPVISDWLGGHWELTGTAVDRITLSKRVPLPALIPFNPACLARGHVFYGHDIATRKPVMIPLPAMTHTLAVGQSGSGKSVFLNQVLLSLLFNIDLIDGLVLVDLKGGVELARYAGLDPKIQVITDYDELPDMAAGLVTTMQQRLMQLRAAGKRAFTTILMFVVIDEYAAIQFRTFADKDAKERHKKLLADLNLLAAQARAPGIKLWAQLQKATADAMDTSFRTNLQSIVAFKIPNINAGLVLDGLDDIPVKPADLPKGQFLLRLDGQPDRIVQASFVPDDIDLRRIVALGQARR